MRLKVYFFAIVAGLVFCCAMPLAADTWTNPQPIDMTSNDYSHDMPSISKDGLKLFFSSDSDQIANGPKDLYFSTMVGESAWSMPTYLGNIINDPIHMENSPCISYDDTLLYFASGNYQDSIWTTYYTNGNWSLPQPLDSTINKYAAGGPAISKDGSLLYFHSNRPGGYGGDDIWKSVKAGGAWQAPINMGPDINTAFNETEFSLAANDSDCVFYRSSDTSNIWHYKIGSGGTAACLFYSHNDTSQPGYNYRYYGPCIRWDGQKIYLTKSPEEMEPVSYICSSDRMTGVEGGPEDERQNVEFKISQNSPNPFSSQTTIKYQMPKSGMVNLKVYNIQGQLVKTLADRVHGAGAYSATWDGRDEVGKKVTNGIYYYLLRAEEHQGTKRMVIIK